MDSELKTGYTRSKVLKRAGVVGAGLFAAPVFASVASASTELSGGKHCAILALNGAPSNTGLGPCDWGDSPARPCPCHQGGYVGPPCDSGDTGSCFCFLATNGCAMCTDLNSITGNACKGNAQCPSGYKCIYTCLDACPNGVGCCDDCTGNSAPSSGPSGKGLTCGAPCTSSSRGGLSAAALKYARAGA
jgi:hypothetical protein